MTLDLHRLLPPPHPQPLPLLLPLQGYYREVGERSEMKGSITVSRRDKVRIIVKTFAYSVDLYVKSLNCNYYYCYMLLITFVF